MRQSSSAAGWGCCGAQPVLDAEGEPAGAAGDEGAQAVVLGWVAADVAAAVDPHDGWSELS